MNRIIPLLLGLAVAAGPVVADSIVVDGALHENVLVQETANLYYVQVPADGTVFVVRKDGTTDVEVRFAPNSATREALRDTWNERYVERRPEFAAVKPAAMDLPRQQAPDAGLTLGTQGTIPMRPTTTVRAAGDPAAYAQWLNTTVTDGYVPYINLREVPLRDALKALLRQLNLDYRIEGDILYVSSAELLRKESLQELESRYYQVSNLGADTLPKIVMMSPQLGGGFGGGGFGGQGGFGAQGGFGGGGFGGQGGFGGGGFGGQGGFGGGGFGGQGGFGGGGFGGGGGGGVDVMGISNISQLFTTIDDRLVGEPPAYIGPSFFVAPARGGQGGGAGAGAGGFAGGMRDR